MESDNLAEGQLIPLAPPPMQTNDSQEIRINNNTEKLDENIVMNALVRKKNPYISKSLTRTIENITSVFSIIF